VGKYKVSTSKKNERTKNTSKIPNKAVYKQQQQKLLLLAIIIIIIIIIIIPLIIEVIINRLKK
jgi:hypothetical protein